MCPSPAGTIACLAVSAARRGFATGPRTENCGLRIASRNRIGSSGDSWQHRLEKLKTGRWFGHFVAASGEKLREIASCLEYATRYQLGRVRGAVSRQRNRDRSK